MTKIEANELLQAFRLYAHDEFGENVSDYMIQDFIKKALTEQNSHKHSVMQAEGSDGANEAAVGQRSVGTNAEARECVTCKHLESTNPYPCGKCDEDYSMWEAPSSGHL